MNDTTIQIITIIGSNLLIMLTIFGVTVSLHNGMREELRGMSQEMKDFHGKLERQDADFKGKMAMQDAEFKAHIMHCHGAIK